LPHVPNTLTEKRLHRFEKRLWLQHHALATAERPVIHGAMTILREYPQILHVHLDEPCFSRPPKYSVIERPGKELRENGD